MKLFLRRLIHLILVVGVLAYSYFAFTVVDASESKSLEEKLDKKVEEIETYNYFISIVPEEQKLTFLPAMQEKFSKTTENDLRGILQLEKMPEGEIVEKKVEDQKGETDEISDK